jgi:hypothetical protein
MTVVNTGAKALRAGDRVRMVIDALDVVQGKRSQNVHISGIPRTKIVARLVHVPVRAASFEDVADGITTRQLMLHLNEPGALTPSLERVGRERYAWSNESGASTYAVDLVAFNAAQDTFIGGVGPTAAEDVAYRARRGRIDDEYQPQSSPVCLAVLRAVRA